MESRIPETDLSSIPMEKTTTIKIIRTSIHTFLKNYNYFTIASLLAIPFSASILLSSSLSPDSISLQQTIHSRLGSVFHAAGFPISSELFSIFNLKLSQTITSSILLLPFTFSFLLLTKTSIIQSLNTHHHRNPPSFAGIFNSILQTQLWNSFLIISANATSFWVLFIAFNCLENLKILPSSTLILLFSMVGGITYSIVVANTMIICNMALVLSGMETKGGFISILKACVMIRRRTPTALSLALSTNIMLAGIEALFQFRVANSRSTTNPTPSMVFEGLFIAYLYSIIITIDTITGVIFYKTCKLAGYKDVIDHEAGRRYGYYLEVKKEDQEELY